MATLLGRLSTDVCQDAGRDSRCANTGTALSHYVESNSAVRGSLFQLRPFQLTHAEQEATFAIPHPTCARIGWAEGGAIAKQEPLEVPGAQQHTDPAILDSPTARPDPGPTPPCTLPFPARGVCLLPGPGNPPCPPLAPSSSFSSLHPCTPRARQRARILLLLMFLLEKPPLK